MGNANCKKQKANNVDDNNNCIVERKTSSSDIDWDITMFERAFDELSSRFEEIIEKNHNLRSVMGCSFFSKRKNFDVTEIEEIRQIFIEMLVKIKDIVGENNELYSMVFPNDVHHSSHIGKMECVRQENNRLAITISELESRCNALNEEIAKLDELNADQRDKLTVLNEEIEKLNELNTTQKDKLSDVESELRYMGDKADDLDKDKFELELKLEDATTLLSEKESEVRESGISYKTELSAMKKIVEELENKVELSEKEVVCLREQLNNQGAFSDTNTEQHLLTTQSSLSVFTGQQTTMASTVPGNCHSIQQQLFASQQVSYQFENTVNQMNSVQQSVVVTTSEIRQIAQLVTTQEQLAFHPQYNPDVHSSPMSTTAVNVDPNYHHYFGVENEMSNGYHGDGYYHLF
uniref:Leucine-rich repeat-containing protein DDB_G0290503-like n=1 Tax=Saccoglossus kowalevskii TaxID=10224 RepID=A0ABM0M903_SACKO|nr:PREDICTED: putative leucine-rich repeat-containing protein DDB_G0290503-like [Saccoglossus kowalevskii]